MHTTSLAPQELELKLGCSTSTAIALMATLKALAGHAPSSQKLENTYYDTPDGRLRQHKTALRIRKIGETALQTVKCAGEVQGGLSQRPEWESPYPGQFEFLAISHASVRQLLESCRTALCPILETHFVRYQSSIVIGSACLDVMLDQGEVSANGQQSPICEVEIELVQGTRQDVYALATKLAASHPLFPSPLSKATRGNRLLGVTPPEPRSREDVFNAFCEALPSNCVGTFDLERCRRMASKLAETLLPADAAELSLHLGPSPDHTTFSTLELGQWLLQYSQRLHSQESSCI